MTRISAALLILIGFALSAVTTDREFIHLSPTPGAASITALEQGKTYEIEFTVYRPIVTRLGIYVRILEENLPDDPLHLVIFANGTQVETRDVPTSLIEDERPTYIQLMNPIRVDPTSVITLQMSVPATLSSNIGIQRRQLDDTFTHTDAVFRIDGAAQKEPAAHNAFMEAHPPFAIQVGGLLVFAGFYVLLRRQAAVHTFAVRVIYAIFIALLAVSPAIILGQVPWTLLVIQIVLFLLALYGIERIGISFLPALFAAHIIALSTWFPLHIPLFISDTAQLPTFKDVLFDPNQTPAANPYGAYVGIPAAILSMIGLLRRGDRSFGAIALGAFIGIVSLNALIADAVAYIVPFHPRHLTIILAGVVAYLGAWGLEYTYRYFGKDDRLVQVLIGAIVWIALLDLLHVLAGTIEYSLL